MGSGFVISLGLFTFFFLGFMAGGAIGVANTIDKRIPFCVQSPAIDQHMSIEDRALVVEELRKRMMEKGQ